MDARVEVCHLVVVVQEASTHRLGGRVLLQANKVGVGEVVDPHLQELLNSLGIPSLSK